MNEPPAGWSRVGLSDVAEFVMGQAPPGDECNKSGTGTPFVKAGEFGPVRPVIREWTTKPLKLARSTDVLICVVGATCGKLNLGADCAIGRSVAAVRPGGAVGQDYLFRFLQTKVVSLRAASTGSAQGVISKEALEAVEVPLAPASEQRRIVAKIDSLSANSKRARDRLSQVSRLVESYRQAVLKSAYSGALTGHGHNGFEEMALGEIIEEGPTNGWSPQSGEDAQGALTLKLTASTSGTLRLDSKAVKRIYESPSPGSPHWLAPGDILVQRANALEHLGATAIYEGPYGTYIYPDLMMRIRVSRELDRRYLWRFLNSDRARSFFRENAAGTAGNMPKISGATLKRLTVPFPDLAIRAEVIRRIDAAFDWIDRLAVEAASARKLIDRLDQAVLAKAFRGDLVQQDPRDEPASILLERIEAERAGVTATRVRRGRPRKTALV